MKCPTCVSENQESCVYPGGTFSTLMCDHRYYDKDGAYHVHDPNTRTTDYRCSYGHEWSESVTPACPACGHKGF